MKQMSKKYAQREEREYDTIRKQETLKKLEKGIRQLKQQVAYKKKPITKYALSKQTGVSPRTIDKYPKIIEVLEKEKNPGIELKTAVINTNKIYSIDEAISIIEQLTDLYNSTKDKYNEGLKINSSLNLKIVNLQDQVKELNRQLKKYQDLINN